MATFTLHTSFVDLGFGALHNVVVTVTQIPATVVDSSGIIRTFKKSVNTGWDGIGDITLTSDTNVSYVVNSTLAGVPVTAPVNVPGNQTGTVNLSSFMAVGTPATPSQFDTLAAQIAALSGTTDASVAGFVGGSGATRTALNAQYVGKGAQTASVRDSAAVGNGVTDDTAAINSAITNNPGREIRFPNNAAGNAVFMVNATANTGVGGQPVGIKLNKPGTRLILDPGVTLKVIPASVTNFSAIQVTAADCSIEGGRITGDVGSHIGTTGEWGHGIDVSAGADRLRIVGTVIEKCWGDGIVVAGAPADVQIIGVVCDSNRRQGLSLIDCVRPTVLGGHFINTGSLAYTAPAAGIDLEPNAGVGNVVDALIIGATFTGNSGAGLLASSNGRTLSGQVVGCISNGSGVGATKVAGFRVQGATNTLELRDNTSKASGGSGFEFFTDTADMTGSGNTAVGSTEHGFSILGDRIIQQSLASNDNNKNGVYVDPTADGCFVSGAARGNSQQSNGTYQNFDVQGTNTVLSSCFSNAGASANKPNYGYTNRTGASGNQYLSCAVAGTFVGGPFLDQALNGRVEPAIGSPVGIPTAAAGAANGASPPAPVVATTARNRRGNVTFGSGTTPAAGSQVVVTYSSTYQFAPFVMVTPKNAATQALGLYVSTSATGSFTVSAATAPTASQAATIYAFDFVVVG